MTRRVYVGNLSWNTTEEGLRQALEQDGRTVTNIDIKTDARSDRSRGFAFADLDSDIEAQATIDELNGTTLDGREITVNMAKGQKQGHGGFGRGDRGGYEDLGGFGGRRGGGGKGRW
jgi:RNA recognition motif-containing protein